MQHNKQHSDSGYWADPSSLPCATCPLPIKWKIMSTATLFIVNITNSCFISCISLFLNTGRPQGCLPGRTKCYVPLGTASIKPQEELDYVGDKTHQEREWKPWSFFVLFLQQLKTTESTRNFIILKIFLNSVPPPHPQKIYFFPSQEGS